MRFTKVPENTFQTMLVNAGCLLSEFDPTNPAIDVSKILGATDGGVNATCVPTFKDLAEGIDNISTNTIEMKTITSYECKLSGTFKTITPELAKMLVCSADTTTSGALTSIKPKLALTEADFKTVWFVGDYSDKNGETKGGFIAIKLSNALNTAGFSLQSTKDDRGTFTAEFVGHNHLNDDTVPFEIYIQAGDDE